MSVLVDEVSQLVKRCESIKLTCTDIKDKLHKDSMVEFDNCPVRYRTIMGKRKKDFVR